MKYWELLLQVTRQSSLGQSESFFRQFLQQLFLATLSRDLKQLKVAKAASMNGNYVYVLPNNTMYKRMTEQHSASEMLMHNGFISFFIYIILLYIRYNQ